MLASRASFWQICSYEGSCSRAWTPCQMMSSVCLKLNTAADMSYRSQSWEATSMMSSSPFPLAMPALTMRKLTIGKPWPPCLSCFCFAGELFHGTLQHTVPPSPTPEFCLYLVWDLLTFTDNCSSCQKHLHMSEGSPCLFWLDSCA